MHENGSMDISAQKESFNAFVTLFKFGTIFVVLLLICMAIFLT